MSYINIKNLKKGEFYQTCSSQGKENMFIFICGEDGRNIFSKRICLVSKSFSSSKASFGSIVPEMQNKIQLASFENRQKLQACIEAGEFVTIKDIIYEIY